MRRHQELLAVELISHYLRGTSKSILFEHLLRFHLVVVIEDLRVDKGRRVRVANALALIVLVEAGVYLADVSRLDGRESLSIQILNEDLRPSLVLNVDGNEVFEAIEFIDDEALSRLYHILPGLVLDLAYTILIISQCSELVILSFNTMVGNHDEKVSQVINMCAHVLSPRDELRGHCDVGVVSVHHPHLGIFFGIRINDEVSAVLGDTDVNVMSLVGVHKDSGLLVGEKVELLHLVRPVHLVRLHVENRIVASSKFNLTYSFKFYVLEHFILIHVLDPSSQRFSVSDVNSERNQRVIIVHLDLVHNCLPDHPRTYEWYLLQIQHHFSPRLRLLNRFKLAHVPILMPAVYLISIRAYTHLVVYLLGEFLVSQEINVVAVFLRDRLDLGVAAAEHVLPPLLVVKGCELDPTLKVLILSLDDSLLPFLVSANVVILIKPIMPVVLRLLKRDC